MTNSLPLTPLLSFAGSIAAAARQVRRNVGPKVSIVMSGRRLARRFRENLGARPRFCLNGVQPGEGSAWPGPDRQTWTRIAAASKA